MVNYMNINNFLLVLNKLIERLQPDNEKIIKKMKKLMEIIDTKNNKEILFNLYEISANWVCYGSVILYFGKEKEKRSIDNIEYKKLSEKINEQNIKLIEIKNDWIKEYNLIKNLL